jgi:mono/diheme cytochrome c family protein
MLRVVAGILAVVAVIGIAWILLRGAETPRPETDQKALSGATSPGANVQPSAGGPADTAAKPNAAAPAESAGAAPAADAGSPLETARTAAKGSLKSPYADYQSVAQEGRDKYLAAGCNGCHGMGGGGMGPPLTNQVWVYGKDDDTLFRLIALGSDELQKQGYVRKGSENVVGPMPPMGSIVKSNDDMWKIIAWIRSVNPSSAEGSSAAATPQAQ